MNERRRTVRIARWSATHPGRAIGLWVVLVAVCVLVGQLAGTQKANSRDLGVGESGRATTMLHDGHLEPRPVENVLITPRTGRLDPHQAKAAEAAVTTRMKALPEVARVASPVAAPRGQPAQLIAVTMRGDHDHAADHVEPLERQTAAVQRAFPQLRIEQVGDGSIDNGVDEQLTKDLGRSETLSLPVTLAILLVAFGAIVAAGVPVLLALSAVFAAIGLSALASHVIPDPGTTSNFILLMGMAVGVDYSLFYLKREREERARGRSHIDAIEIAAATSGHSVIVSASAVMVAMAGLYLAGDTIFSSLATGGIIVAAVAMLGSLTVLPALLGKLGRAIDRPRVPLLWRLTNRSGEPRLWRTLLRPALRRPALTLVVAVVALAALASPLVTMKLRSTGPDTLPKTIPAVQTYDRMTTAFPTENESHEIVVQAPPGQAAPVTDALESLQTQARHQTLFGAQTGRVEASADGRYHALQLDVAHPAGSAEARRSLDVVRHDLLPATVGRIAGTQYAVGGTIADNVDYAHHTHDKLPWVMAFVLLLTLVMMMVTFRSVVVALTAIAVNLLSVAAAFGALVLVFQHHWADGLLGYHASGAIVAWIPLFLFAVLFGLSMDYHVFVVSRIREAAQRGRPTREAVEQGITGSAGVVTSAAVVMVSVFAIFASLSMLEMKQLGVGLAVAVLIDALVVRAIVLPAAMVVLGRANWWPSRLSRRPERAPVAEPQAPQPPQPEPAPPLTVGANGPFHRDTVGR